MGGCGKRQPKITRNGLLLQTHFTADKKKDPNSDEGQEKKEVRLAMALNRQ